MTGATEMTDQEIRRAADEQYYQDLVKSIENQVAAGNLSQRAFDIFKEGLLHAVGNENKSYSERHMRIYGMLRQGLDYVREHAPELNDEMLAAAKTQIRDIEESEWTDMTVGTVA